MNGGEQLDLDRKLTSMEADAAIRDRGHTPRPRAESVEFTVNEMMFVRDAVELAWRMARICEAQLSNPTEIKTDEFVFTRDDALKLCLWWQDYAWGKPERHTADNLENFIEELCLAWGFTVEEVRATWWSRRKPANT